MLEIIRYSLLEKHLIEQDGRNDIHISGHNRGISFLKHKNNIKVIYLMIIIKLL